MPTHEQLLEVRVLLREGKPQEAADLLQKLEDDDLRAAGAAPAKPAAPPPPRAPNVIMLHLLTEIVAHLGNKPSLEALIEELRAVTK